MTDRRAASRTPLVEPLRVLIVVSRPKADIAMDFVAGPIMRALAGREHVRAELLRPSTYESLAARLSHAHEAREPFHIVHFDGHGEFGVLIRTDDDGTSAQAVDGGTPQGWILFEPPIGARHGDRVPLEREPEYVDGRTLGALLVRTDVPVAVIHACRSAYSDAWTRRESGHQTSSLAEALLAEGVTAVVAMQYSVYADAAAALMQTLYRALADGCPLRAAMTIARRHVGALTPRNGTGRAEWPVPVLFEAQEETVLTVREVSSAAAEPAATIQIDSPPPDPVTYGRDNVVLALDRVFDVTPLVVLHGPAGCGKSAIARTFARWYDDSGGSNVPVIVSDLTRSANPEALVDAALLAWRSILETAGYRVEGLTGRARLTALVDVLMDMSALWVWDGFQAARDNRRIVQLLEMLITSGCRLLLTSRTGEDELLGDSASRVEVPPLAGRDCARLVRDRLGSPSSVTLEAAAVDPLVGWSSGNPGALCAAVDVWRRGDLTAAAAESLVQRLDEGSDLDESEASLPTVAAMLAAVADARRTATHGDARARALIYLFRRAVSKIPLEQLPDRLSDAHVSPPIAIADLRGALDWCVMQGLASAHSVMWMLHPASAWALRPAFESCFGAASIAVHRAWVDAMAFEAVLMENQYQGGLRDLDTAIRLESFNFERARVLARAHRWQDRAIQATQALFLLSHEIDGDRARAAQLADDLAADIIDPATGHPYPGREEGFPVVATWRAITLAERGEFGASRRAQTAAADWLRPRVASALQVPAAQWSPRERRELLWLANLLSNVQWSSAVQAAAVPDYEEALKIFTALSHPGEALAASNLAAALLANESPDFDRIEGLIQRSYGLRKETDAIGRARCLMRLAALCHTRSQVTILDARESDNEETAVRAGVDDTRQAIAHLEEAIGMLPKRPHEDLATAHANLAAEYGLLHRFFDAPEALERCTRHFLHALNVADALGLDALSAKIALNTAKWMQVIGQYDAARGYARSALRRAEAAGVEALSEQLAALETLRQLDEPHQEGEAPDARDGTVGRA
jgi:hypothetical protein